MSERIIFHIDVNSAFLSWEAVYRLKYLNDTVDLREIPSAVSGNKNERHGIILAKSIPAKKYNVRTAEAIGDALKKCPELVLVAPRYKLYEQCSNAFMDILREYSDIVEPYSIDEAFVDMTGTCHLFGTPITVANAIKDRIRNELGFTVNVGISSTKLLAKMASDFKKPDLVHTLFPDEIAAKMWPLPVSELIFIGRSTAKKLIDLGIRTIYDLAHTDLAILQSHFGKISEFMLSYANGIDPSPVHAVSIDNKGYGNSVTIPHDVTDAAEAKLILLSLCETVGSRLRKDNTRIKVIAVSVRDCFLSTARHQKTLSSATDITTELYIHVCELFDEIWNGKTPIRQLGVHTSCTDNDSSRQFSMFDSYDYTRQGKFEKTVDDIRNRFGLNSVMRASLLDSGVENMAGGIKREKRQDLEI